MDKLYSQGSFRWGTQYEFSMEIPFQRDFQNIDGLRDRKYSGIEYECGVFFYKELNSGFNLIVSSDLRFQQRGGSTFNLVNYTLSQAEIQYFRFRYRSISLSPSIGVNIEVFKRFDFDVVAFGGYNFNLVVNRSVNFDYVISYFTGSSITNNFGQTYSQETPPVFETDNYFGKVEFGLGLGFEHFLYDFVVSKSAEKLGSQKWNYGIRMRYFIK